MAGRYYLLDIIINIEIKHKSMEWLVCRLVVNTAKKFLHQHLLWCHGNIWHSFGSVAVDLLLAPA